MSDLAPADVLPCLRLGGTPPDAALLARLSELIAGAPIAPRSAFRRDGARMLLCATLGAAFDTWQRRLAACGATDAFLAQAIGSVAIEREMDALEKRARASLGEGETLSPRRSPGYGAMPLSDNRAILAKLDAAKTLGVTLTASLQLLPSKSVTAVCPIRRAPTPETGDTRPVGFFDSGLGGLCIRAAFRRTCPHESTVYIADSTHCPYGNLPAAEIVRLARANTERLLREYDCKAVVVACNTATAAAIDTLRADWPEVPFVGLEPAVKPAALSSKTGVVGVLATAGTFNGRLYRETTEKFAKGVTVIATVADEFVTLVERYASPDDATGESLLALPADAKAEIRAAVRTKIEPLLAAGADAIVLGCTHFPHLKPFIAEVAADRAVILDPSEAVARQTARVLAERGLAAQTAAPTHLFLTSPTS